MESPASSREAAYGAVDPAIQLMGYPWPASKLTRADMIKLTELRNRTGRPMTKLLHEAVAMYYELLTRTSGIDRRESAELSCGSPSECRGAIDNAETHCVNCGSSFRPTVKQR